ncbi:MAG TPA: crotonase/enoyl-CoA hydratase family protein [Myxococcota bacterium]|nr:crotonase/enoyl-CoA hydratase family protein [Myxococcota bacterium]
MTETERHPDGQISVEQRDRILVMGLDRREKYNGLTPKMVRELGLAYTRLDEDPALWVGVLFGHGKHFTAGLDLPKWTEGMRDPNARRERDRSDRVDPMALARTCRKPIVTAVHGITYTAGIELMLAGDIVVAADDCRFSQLEPKRGIHATGGATIRFVERGGWGNAMYHLLTSDEFGAEEARRIGLVQEIVPRGTELARALELAGQIAAMAPLAVQATKASSRRYLDHGFAATVAAFAADQAALAVTEDAREGVASFVERRDPKFTGR